MLQKLGDHIKACLERAEQCKAGAELVSDTAIRAQLSDLERQWRHLAQSYEFIVSLEHFLLDQQKQALPIGGETLSKDSPIQ